MATFRAIAGLTLAVALGALGCKGEEVSGCRRDSDCAAGFRCSADRVCLCTLDDACADGEYCNAEGFCQIYQGCRTAADCGEAGAWLCQLSTGVGQCLCLTNAACPAGQVCNASGSCQEKVGCLLDADCGEAAQWRCRVNPSTQIGECLCEDHAACAANEFCNTAGYCQPKTTCTSNADCPAGRFCNMGSGECLCNTEAQTGCRSDEVCNASGYCQPRPGCFDNQDCTDIAGTYCDLTTRTCVALGSCTSSMQCPIGQVCRLRVCTDGCDTSGDCPLDERCVNFQCQAGCQSQEFCDFIEFCTDGQCQSAYSAQDKYCEPCTGGDLLGCGTRGNSCLIYPYETDDFYNAGNGEYCAPDCADGQPCPNGFQCSTVVSVKSSDLCYNDSECPAGLPCLKSSEEDQGYCPCAANNPCPTNTCYTLLTCFMGSCLGLGLPCTQNSDCYFCETTTNPCTTNADCEPVVCEHEDGENYGGCVSARACGLTEGYHCIP